MRLIREDANEVLEDSDQGQEQISEESDSSCSQKQEEQIDRGGESDFVADDDVYAFKEEKDRRAIGLPAQRKERIKDGVQRFNHFARTTNMVKVQRNKIQEFKLDGEINSNKTIFNERFCAQPLRLKQALATVNPLISPPTQAERIKQPAFPIQFSKGIYYRNINRDQEASLNMNYLKPSIQVPDSKIGIQISSTLNKIKNSDADKIDMYERCKSAS